MKKSKILLTICGALTLLGGLFSCSNNPASTSNATSTSSTASSIASTSGTSQNVTIDFWHTSGQGIDAGYVRYAKKFAELVKQNEGVDLTIKCSYQGGYPDILDKVTKSFATGTAPAIAIAYPDHVANYIAMQQQDGRQYVADLSKLASDPNIGFGKQAWIGDGEASDFVPTFYQEGQNYVIEGMYSLPFLKSTEVLFYNIDQVHSYAKSYKPGELISTQQVEKWMSSLTWDEFMEFATYIKEHKDSKSALEVPVYYDSDSNLFISKCYQEDIPFISLNDGKMSVDFDNPKARAMVEKLKTSVDAGVLTTKGKVGTYGSSYFTSEKCIFSIGSSGGAGYQDPSGDFSLGVCQVPHNGKKKYVTQGPTLTILRNPGDTDAVNDLKTKYAWEFVKYLTSTDINIRLTLGYSEGYSPVRKSCYETADYQEYISEEGAEIFSKTAKVVIGLEDNYILTPSAKGSAAARTEVGNLLTQYFINKKTLDQAFADAVTETKKAM